MTVKNFITAGAVVLLLLAISACAPTSTQSPGNALSADSDITENVKAAAKNDTKIDASTMDVTTANGVVHLSGFVTSHAQVTAATDVARGITGVTAVTNDMMVRTVR